MNLELRPGGTDPNQPTYRQVTWSAKGSQSDVNSNIGPGLSELGVVKPATVDLVRLATAAYIADRVERRGEGYSRSVNLHLQLVEPDRWMALIPQVEDLLRWISNDDWQITVSSDGQSPKPTIETSEGSYERVALLSGGLDSFSGAVLGGSLSRLFVSHSDNQTITAAQTRTWAALDALDVQGNRFDLKLREADGTVEKSTRTRSFLFYALAVAAAGANGVQVVEVPENGFTSINVPLTADRGGVLTTRSTHPLTILKVRTLLADAGIEVWLDNPYEWHTKGELVSSAAASATGFSEQAAKTLSCAKLDGHTFKGGNPNFNCGACVACLTRRGAFLAYDVDDETSYLTNTLPAASRRVLLHKRRADIESVRSAVLRAKTFDGFDLLGSTQLPLDYDVDRAVEMIRKGFVELELAVETL